MSRLSSAGLQIGYFLATLAYGIGGFAAKVTFWAAIPPFIGDLQS